MDTLTHIRIEYILLKRYRWHCREHLYRYIFTHMHTLHIVHTQIHNIHINVYTLSCKVDIRALCTRYISMFTYFQVSCNVDYRALCTRKINNI
mgnify:CR=1 FL=1